MAEIRDRTGLIEALARHLQVRTGVILNIVDNPKWEEIDADARELYLDEAAAPRSDRNWIQTFTGRPYWPHDPRPEDVCIEDVAHALSQLCRYTGHTRRFYSVAEHSVHVSRLVPPDLALQGLLHDAHEAYVNDVATPMKRGLPDYRQVEDLNQAVVLRHFGLPAQLDKRVHEADALMLQVERKHLMAPCSKDWGLGNGWLPELPPLGLDPLAAEALFLARYSALSAAR